MFRRAALNEQASGLSASRRDGVVPAVLRRFVPASRPRPGARGGIMLRVVVAGYAALDPSLGAALADGMPIAWDAAVDRLARRILTEVWHGAAALDVVLWGDACARHDAAQRLRDAIGRGDLIVYDPGPRADREAARAG